MRDVTGVDKLVASAAVVRTYGFTVEDVDIDGFTITTPETDFVLNEDESWSIGMWSGSYPFNYCTEMPGTVSSVEEAARWASWLLKREDHYHAMTEAFMQKACTCTPGSWFECIVHG